MPILVFLLSLGWAANSLAQTPFYQGKTITIIVGNVGALGQSSLKRMLAYSSVAQAGYMLAGVVVTTQLGVAAVAFYLAVYLLMNLAAFAVITIRERSQGVGDDISSLNGLGAGNPILAWTITIAMLALAGCAYAYAAVRICGVRRQAAIHVLLLAWPLALWAFSPSAIR